MPAYYTVARARTKNIAKMANENFRKQRNKINNCGIINPLFDGLTDNTRVLAEILLIARIFHRPTG